MLERHLIVRAFRFAAPSAGTNKDARTAMIAMTTSNSIKVNPAPDTGRHRLLLLPIFIFLCR